MEPNANRPAAAAGAPPPYCSLGGFLLRRGPVAKYTRLSSQGAAEDLHGHQVQQRPCRTSHDGRLAGSGRVRAHPLMPQGERPWRLLWDVAVSPAPPPLSEQRTATVLAWR